MIVGLRSGSLNRVRVPQGRLWTALFLANLDISKVGGWMDSWMVKRKDGWMNEWMLCSSSE